MSLARGAMQGYRLLVKLTKITDDKKNNSKNYDINNNPDNIMGSLLWSRESLRRQGSYVKAWHLTEHLAKS